MAPAFHSNNIRIAAARTDGADANPFFRVQKTDYDSNFGPVSTSLPAIKELRVESNRSVTED